MDESVYRQVLSTSVALHCPFEKAILTQCVACSRTEKRHIAEREVVGCNRAEANNRCIALRDLLRQKFTFALGRLHIDGPLPHAQEMRLQCGGLKGLQFILDGRDEVDDVAGLVASAEQKYGGMANLPFVKIIRQASTLYKPR